MNEIEINVNDAESQPKRGLLRRVIEHLLAGIIGLVFSFPIALPICLFLFSAASGGSTTQLRFSLSSAFALQLPPPHRTSEVKSLASCQMVDEVFGQIGCCSLSCNVRCFWGRSPLDEFTRCGVYVLVVGTWPKMRHCMKSRDGCESDAGDHWFPNSSRSSTWSAIAKEAVAAGEGALRT